MIDISITIEFFQKLCGVLPDEREWRDRGLVISTRAKWLRRELNVPLPGDLLRLVVSSQGV
jgi:hypothetical protein